MIFINEQIDFWERVYKYANHSKKKAKAKKELLFWQKYKRFIEDMTVNNAISSVLN